MKVVIIGAGSAGASCAFELRKLDKKIDITILEKSNNYTYSPCALPYVLSGEIKNFKDITVFGKEAFESNNINLILNVKNIKIKNKTIITNETSFNFDKLVIATGSKSFIPNIKGVNNSKYFTLKTIDDAKKIKIKPNLNYVIIGAGMIGVELANSISQKKGKVSLIEGKENILPNILDSDVAKEIEKYLIDKKIKLLTSKNVLEIKNKNIILENEKVKFDELIISTGIIPELSIAQDLKLKTNKGILVDDYLRTSNKNIYSCGDCTLSEHFETKKKILSGLGTVAVMQAKIVAKNILGFNEKFKPVLNNTISKIGEKFVASVGITQNFAKENNIKVVSAKYTDNLRAEYYSTKEKITIRLISKLNGRLVGAQIIGDNEVVGRINLLSYLIQNKKKVDEILKIENCYNPASSPIFEPLNVVAQILIKKLNNLK